MFSCCPWLADVFTHVMCSLTCQGSRVSGCLWEEQSKESQTEEKGLSIFQAPLHPFHLLKVLRPFQSVRSLLAMMYSIRLEYGGI